MLLSAAWATTDKTRRNNAPRIFDMVVCGMRKCVVRVYTERLVKFTVAGLHLNPVYRSIGQLIPAVMPPSTRRV